MSTAILMTTYNRPEALARSLPQVARFGLPILVVDDGSDFDKWQWNRSVCGDYDTEWLRMPSNRGLACALNAGLAYWLADHDVDWVSYFQDDVDVRGDCMDVLAAVQGREGIMFLTGHDAAEHPHDCEKTVNGVRMVGKGNCRATHMHAHRDYWQGVMPIQSKGLHTPCKPDIMPEEWRKRVQASGDMRGCGSEVDHWITHRAPKSAVAQGRHAWCVPGLVRTFLWEGKDSCWNNTAPRGPDSELPGWNPQS